MLKFKKISPYLIILTFIFYAGNNSAQSNAQGSTTKADDYVGKTIMRYEDYTYSDIIKSVQLHDESHQLSLPILNLDEFGKLKLSFDDLGKDFKNYSFSFIHCNSNWIPSNLLTMEYIDGFQENQITDYQYSSGTLQKYVHYNAVFPDETTRFILSGNYLLKVYENGNPEHLIITRRFIVFQNKVTINATITRAGNASFQNYNQELDFNIQHPDYPIPNPYSDLKIVLCKNNNWANAKTDLQPLFVKNDELVYDLSKDNVFPGGNEFRNINIKSIRFKSDRISTINSAPSFYHVYIYPDELRSYKTYEFIRDINGKFLIQIQEGTNSEIEADYCLVNFFLPLEEPSLDGNIYIFGAFNGWQCERENMAHYNEKRKGYETDILLKQGYYNYNYVYIKNGSTKIDETFIEGTHYETENNYTILVYHKQRGTFYDQLIGIKHIGSGK